MKYVRWGVTGLTLLMVLLVGIQYMASERVEVVELHTLDEAGETVTTRLWIVDDEGYQYLRAGIEGNGWYHRIEANDSLELTRNGETLAYTAVQRRDKSEVINRLMQEKYTWGDSFIGVMLGSRDSSVPIELHRL